MPPWQAARTARRKKATPQAQSAVAGTMCSSSMTSVAPTARNNSATRSSAPAWAASAARHVIDSRSATAVLGIARTIGTSGPTCRRIAAIDAPETTDTRRCRPASTRGAIPVSTASRACGWTATSTVSHAATTPGLSADTRKPRSARSASRSTRLRVTWTSAGAYEPAATSPSAMARPMFPAPMMATLSHIVVSAAPDRPRGAASGR